MTLGTNSLVRSRMQPSLRASEPDAPGLRTFGLPNIHPAPDLWRATMCTGRPEDWTPSDNLVTDSRGDSYDYICVRSSSLRYG